MGASPIHFSPIFFFVFFQISFLWCLLYLSILFMEAYMSSVVEVEIGVPLPVMKRRYPYADMEIGDSFLVVDRKNTRLNSSHT